MESEGGDRWSEEISYESKALSVVKNQPFSLGCPASIQPAQV